MDSKELAIKNFELDSGELLKEHPFNDNDFFDFLRIFKQALLEAEEGDRSSKIFNQVIEESGACMPAEKVSAYFSYLAAMHDLN